MTEDEKALNFALDICISAIVNSPINRRSPISCDICKYDWDDECLYRDCPTESEFKKYLLEEYKNRKKDYGY